MLCQLVANKIENDVYGDMQIEESLESLIALQCKWSWLSSKIICKLQIGIDLQASLMFKQMLFEVRHLLIMFQLLQWMTLSWCNESFYKDTWCALRQIQQCSLTNLDDTLFNTKLPTLYLPKFGGYQINTKVSLYFWNWIIFS